MYSDPSGPCTNPSVRASASLGFIICAFPANPLAKISNFPEGFAPETSMPADRPGALSRGANAGIVAYILKVDKLPAGNNGLPSDADLLKQIQFEAATRGSSPARAAGIELAHSCLPGRHSCRRLGDLRSPLDRGRGSLRSTLL
jgi:hypothetical protein